MEKRTYKNSNDTWFSVGGKVTTDFAIFKQRRISKLSLDEFWKLFLMVGFSRMFWSH